MSNLKDIEDRAAAWLAQRDAGQWSEADESALEAWLDLSTAHRVTYLRFERVWEETARLKVLAAGRPAEAPGWIPQGPFFEAQENPPVDRARASAAEPGLARARFRDSRVKLRVFALAASVLLVAALGGYLALYARAGDRFETPVGGTASVPLPDGSHITLNTATELRVDLSPDERRVDLQRGEAYFVVAKDPKRPFVVAAGSRRIVAVGTQFSVRRDGDRVEVVVTEGVVRLESSGGSALPATAGGRLPAGAIARVTGDDVLIQERTVPETEAALSWRKGYLTFRETTLATAVEEFNRYNEQKLRIVDPKVAEIRISGTFRPTNAEAFVRLLKEGFSIDARTTNDAITLTQN